ncbi:MAG: alpha-glucuronidase family glycosyl hydrolase, partial [Planctomycetota bacterium]
EPLTDEGLTRIEIGKGFFGFLDDVRIYRSPLSAEEAARIYRATRPSYDGRSDSITPPRKLKVYRYRAEDAPLYDAWLRYPRLAEDYDASALRRIVLDADHPTLRTAAEELRGAIRKLTGIDPQIEGQLAAADGSIVLGTPGTSDLIRSMSDSLPLDRVKDDGFLIQRVEHEGKLCVVVAAGEPAGVIFGAFALIRRICLGEEADRLRVVSNPKYPIRIIGHWCNFRGYAASDWKGKEVDPCNWEADRYNSIYSWDELRSGDTRRIEGWARLLASAGWNAVCPTEINWRYQNNFLNHLAETKTLATILRKYGIRLYWTPNYLLAQDPATAEALYAAVPDFGGYLLKVGSEGQGGSPRADFVNRVADCVGKYGGTVLLRAFVYGNKRYTDDPYRNMIPYDVFTREDGKYRDNVIVVPKGSALDWDLAAPIPSLDGALSHTRSGVEFVVHKKCPLSWVEKWKWWFDHDTHRQGPGSFNKDRISCVLGVAMITPSPAWTSLPPNMVNYYGIGRLAWDPEMSVDRIYEEWARMTLGPRREAVDVAKEILLLSDDVVRKLYLYRGYQGIWIDRGNSRTLTQSKTPHEITRRGIGVSSPELERRILAQYAPGLRKIYGDLETCPPGHLAFFHFLPWDHRLPSGRTVKEDLVGNLDEGVEGAQRMLRLWRRLDGKIDARYFRYTQRSLERFVRDADTQRKKMKDAFREVIPR